MQPPDGASLTPQLASSPLMQRELARFEAKCACSRRISSWRAELHRTLDRVLVM